MGCLRRFEASQGAVKSPHAAFDVLVAFGLVPMKEGKKPSKNMAQDGSIRGNSNCIYLFYVCSLLHTYCYLFNFCPS